MPRDESSHHDVLRMLACSRSRTGRRTSSPAGAARLHCSGRGRAEAVRQPKRLVADGLATATSGSPASVREPSYGITDAGGPSSLAGSTNHRPTRQRVRGAGQGFFADAGTIDQLRTTLDRSSPSPRSGSPARRQPRRRAGRTGVPARMPPTCWSCGCRSSRAERLRWATWPVRRSLVASARTPQVGRLRPARGSHRRRRAAIR